SYFSIAFLSSQGLRQLPNTTGGRQSVTENNSVFPIVAPLIEGRWDPDFDVAGGQLHFVGSAVLLNRSESPFVTTPTSAVPGPNSRRASGDFDWTRTFTLSNGMRFEPFADVRGD